MGFFSFLGRVLFASLFILSAWQMFNEFDANGGPIAKELIPKLTVVRKNLSSKLGVAIPNNIDLMHLALTTPLLYDFYNYRPGKPEHALLLNEFMLNTALFGALLFFIGMKNSIPKRQLRKKTPKPKTV